MFALGCRDTHNISRVNLGNSNDIETAAQDAVLREQVCSFFNYHFMVSFANSDKLIIYPGKFDAKSYS